MELFHGIIQGLYTPTAFPSGLQVDSVGLRVTRIDFFLLFNHCNFLMLVQAFLVGPPSPTDFSDGLPMNWEQTNTLSPLEMTSKHQWKSSGQPAEVQRNSNRLLLLLLYNIKKPQCRWIGPSTSGAHEDKHYEHSTSCTKKALFFRYILYYRYQ